MKMKRFSTILGIALTITILMSGSVLATWVYIHEYVPGETYDCTDPEEAEGQWDLVYATVGVNTPSPKLGHLVLDFGVATSLPPNHEFSVFASSTVKETYQLQLKSYLGTTSSWYRGMDDTTKEDRTSPSLPDGDSWRYVIIESETGSIGIGDTIYGSEIDAVGWDS